MRSFVYPIVASVFLVSATPVTRDVSDTSLDMDNIIAGRSTCASTAIIFARGTFDSGNIGVWVGPAFKNALSSKVKSVAFQGVNREDYPAVLEQYLDEGGSESCADALAETVDAYASKCPTSNIVVSGWSQGALCAHKGLVRINNSALPQIKALITFGDPNGVNGETDMPQSVRHESYCVEDTVFPDPLCTTLSEGFRLPRSFGELHDLALTPLRSLPDFATGVQQTKAAAGLVPEIAKGLANNAGTFASDLVTGNLRRWLVVPQHFVYGNNGMAAEAANVVAKL